MKKKIIDERPWGKFEQFTHNEVSTVKILTVKPGEKLSLQYHYNREEFWRVLSGEPIVLVGDEEKQAKKGDEFFIAKEANHRLMGGNETAEILEIAFGDFDENDIVRVEDNYGRK